jgi:HEAT repeat protein
MSVIVRSLFLGLLLIVGSQAHSAIPKSPTERIKSVRAEGKQGLKKLRAMAFDQTQTVEVRWKSFVTFAMIGGKDVLPEIEKAIQSPDWFMRDAGIKTLRKIDPKQAVRWSKHLLSDPSLVVRTSAVSTLRTLKDNSSKTLLWEKLDSQQNFRGKQSLWVRHHIVRALADLAEKGEEQRFLKILSDSDVRLHAPASLALTKITGLKPTSSGVAAVDFWKTKIHQ